MNTHIGANLKDKREIKNERIFLIVQAWSYIAMQRIVNNHLTSMSSIRTKYGMIGRSPQLVCQSIETFMNSYWIPERGRMQGMNRAIATHPPTPLPVEYPHIHRSPHTRAPRSCNRKQLLTPRTPTLRIDRLG